MKLVSWDWTGMRPVFVWWCWMCSSKNSYDSQRPVYRKRWQIKCQCHKQFSSHSQRSPDCCYCNFSLRLFPSFHHHHLTLFSSCVSAMSSILAMIFDGNILFSLPFLWNLSSHGKLGTTGETRCEEFMVKMKMKKSIRERFEFVERWRILIQWFRNFSSLSCFFSCFLTDDEVFCFCHRCSLFST